MHLPRLMQQFIQGEPEATHTTQLDDLIFSLTAQLKSPGFSRHSCNTTQPQDESPKTNALVDLMTALRITSVTPGETCSPVNQVFWHEQREALREGIKQRTSFKAITYTLAMDNFNIFAKNLQEQLTLLTENQHITLLLINNRYEDGLCHSNVRNLIMQRGPEKADLTLMTRLDEPEDGPLIHIKASKPGDLIFQLKVIMAVHQPDTIILINDNNANIGECCIADLIENPSYSGGYPISKQYDEVAFLSACRLSAGMNPIAYYEAILEPFTAAPLKNQEQQYLAAYRAKGYQPVLPQLSTPPADELSSLIRDEDKQCYTCESTPLIEQYLQLHPLFRQSNQGWKQSGQVSLPKKVLNAMWHLIKQQSMKLLSEAAKPVADKNKLLHLEIIPNSCIFYVLCTADSFYLALIIQNAQKPEIYKCPKNNVKNLCRFLHYAINSLEVTSTRLSVYEQAIY